MVTFILALLVFSILIIVHELGHFIAAKKSGVRVNEFWLGMGPNIYKKQVGETLYCLKLFPIGGAVVMEGEDADSKHPNSFDNARKLHRGMIILAGAFMNFVLGFLIIFIINMPADKLPTSVVESLEPGFKYEEWIKPGDEILEIDGFNILVNSDVSFALSRANGNPTDIKIMRDGKKVMLESVPIKLDTFNQDGKEIERYGLNFMIEDATFLGKLENTWNTGINYARMVWVSLGDLITGKVSVKQLSGPIGISKVIGDVAQVSIASMFMLMAFISINLGVMNLLPLPALDGGRFVFLGLEAIRGKKVISAKAEGYINMAGLLALFALMIYVTFNDIVNIFFK